MPTQVTSLHPVKVGADSGTPKIVKNISGNTVYYRSEPFVSSSTNDGSLTENQEVTINTTNWFVTKAVELASNKKEEPVDGEIRVTAGNVTLPSTSQIGTANLEAGAVTAPKLAGLFSLTSGALDPTGEKTPRSSINWPGSGIPLEITAQAVEVGNWIAVPVLPGDVFKKVAIVAGKKATGTVKEYINAIYVGETGGALIAQSKSITPAESHPKEETYAVELESTVTITATNAPKGYVYVLVSCGAAGTVFNFIGSTYATAQQAILAISGTAGAAANALMNSGGSAIKTKAEATVPTLTAVAGVPYVSLY